MRAFLSFGAAVLTISSLGCGSNEIEYAPAEGVVTMGGKPLEGAQLVLEIEHAPADLPKPTSRGVTDSSGRFQMKTLTPEKELVNGAVVGTHRVMITTRIVEQTANGATRVVRDELLGDSYINGDELTATIPSSGVADLKFEVSPKK